MVAGACTARAAVAVVAGACTDGAAVAVVAAMLTADSVPYADAPLASGASTDGAAVELAVAVVADRNDDHMVAVVPAVSSAESAVHEALFPHESSIEVACSSSAASSRYPYS